MFYIELDRFHSVGRLTHTFTQDGKKALEKRGTFLEIIFEGLIINQIGSEKVSAKREKKVHDP